MIMIILCEECESLVWCVCVYVCVCVCVFYCVCLCMGVLVLSEKEIIPYQSTPSQNLIRTKRMSVGTSYVLF